MRNRPPCRLKVRKLGNNQRLAGAPVTEADVCRALAALGHIPAKTWCGSVPRSRAHSAPTNPYRPLGRRGGVYGIKSQPHLPRRRLYPSSPGSRFARGSPSLTRGTGRGGARSDRSGHWRQELASIGEPRSGVLHAKNNAGESHRSA